MEIAEQWRIRDLLELALRDAYGRFGTTPKEQRAFVDVESDRILIKRPAVGHETQVNAPQDGPYIKRNVSATTANGIVSAAERFAMLHMALKERERHVEGAWAENDQIPSWTLIGDSLLVHMLNRSGHMHEVGTLARSGGEGGLLADTRGLVLKAPEARGVMIGGKMIRVSPMNGWVNGGLFVYAVKLRSGADSVITYDGGRQPKLTITDIMLPDTIIGSIAGRRLDEVVSHPLLDGSPAVVSSARNTGEDSATSVAKVEILLKRHRVPFAPAPEGVDAPWLETIAALSA